MTEQLTEQLDRIAGWCCPANLNGDEFTRLIKGPYFDADGYQCGERINGVAQCPDCGRWWPLIESVEAWQMAGDNLPERFRGKWIATEWGPGHAECVDCELAIVDSFDGTYVIRHVKTEVKQ